MEKNISLENRLSFNRPIAESTLRANISNSPSFQWGQKNLNSTIVSRKSPLSPVRDRNGLSKIDARIYADVQSRGLTSRIVKYHESGTRLNRSISMNNLSNEGKQFPALRTTKPELPYKASKQNVSMTHIAPPDKSAFYGNTLSGLLRSSSVIALQHNDDDLSSENRPIIHPPATEKELQPTRSVLEVLKEISRKRINNEDADEADTSKKYCNRIENEFNGTMQPDYRNALLQASQSYKRQRESAVEYFNSNHVEQHSSVSKQQNRQEAPSPEQQTAKRRNCNYNNDITSSLSSSKKSHNKRKLFDSEGEKQQEKQLRYQPEIRLPELSTALSYVANTPITPLPNTPQTNKNLSENETPLPTPIQKSISAPIPTGVTLGTTYRPMEKPKLTLFNKNYDLNKEESVDEPSLNEDDNACAGIQFVKPKKSVSSIGGSQLLMERTQKSKLALMLSGLRGELYLGDEEEKTVQPPPKKEEEKKLVSNQDQPKSFEKSVTTTTTAGNVTSTATTFNTNAVDGVPKTKSIFTLTTSRPVMSIQPTKITSPLTGIKLTPQTTAAEVKTTKSTPIAPTFSFGVATTGTLSTTSTTTTNSTTTNPSVINVPNNMPQNNAPPGGIAFSFGEPKKSESTAPTSSQTTLPTFGVATGQDKTNAFKISAPAAVISTASAAVTTSAPTMAPLFSFNKNPMPSTVSSNSTTTQTSAAFTTTTATFSFPVPQSQSTSTTQNSTVVPASTANKTTPFAFGKPSGGFSFGATTNPGPTQNVLPTTDVTKTFNFTAPKATTASGGFSFGSTTTETKTTTAGVLGHNAVSPIKFGVPVPSGQQQQKTASEPPATTTTFVFGSKSTNATTTTPATNANTFGTFAVNQTQPFSFGGTPPSKTTSESTMPTNIFNLQKTAPSKTFSFGGSAVSTTPATVTTTANTFNMAFNNNNNANNNNNNNNNNQTSIFSFGGSNNNAASSVEAPKQTNSFSFATNTTNKPFAFNTQNVDSQKPAFGTDQSKSFSFGTSNNANNNVNEAPKVNTFNFSTPNQNTFNFGGINNKPNNVEQPQMTGNVTINATPSNAFTFGAVKSPLGQTNAFSTASSGGQSNVFNFSGSNNNQLQASTNNVPVVKPNNSPFNTFSNATQGNTFNFGNVNNNGVTETAAPKPTTFSMANNVPKAAGTFVFGSSSNNNPTVPNGNLFTMTNSNSNTQSPSPFGGMANTTNTAQNANIFAVPPSSDRPIRRATRRLTKS